MKQRARKLLDLQCDGWLPARGDLHKEGPRQHSWCLLPGRGSAVPAVFCCKGGWNHEKCTPVGLRIVDIMFVWTKLFLCRS